MQATITAVFPEPRLWGSKFPDACSIGGLFDNGSQWEVATKIGAPAEKHMEALKSLIGKPSEFTVEAKPDYQGMKQWKVTEYPGKPTGQGGQGFGGGGGGRQFVPAFHQTEAGMAVEQERMDRRTALMQSVLRCEGLDTDDVALLSTAEAMYNWLRKTAGQPVQQPQQASQNGHTAQPSQSAQPVSNTVITARPATPQPPSSLTWDGQEGTQCPVCHAPSGKRHGKQCMDMLASTARESETEEDRYSTSPH